MPLPLPLKPCNSDLSIISAGSQASSISTQSYNRNSLSITTQSKPLDGSLSPLSNLSANHANIILSYADIGNNDNNSHGMHGSSGISNISNISVNSINAYPNIALEPVKPNVTSPSGPKGKIPTFTGMGLAHDPLNLSMFSSKSVSRGRSNSVPDTAEYETESTNKLSEGKECECVQNCKAIKRCIIALKWYSECVNDRALLLERIMNEFGGNPYDNYLLRDYQHILNCHLMQQFEIKMGMEYSLIKNELNKYVGVCDIERCDGYKRYKAKMDEKKENSDGDKKKRKSQDEESFFLDFMDLIHCFLMHLEYVCIKKGNENENENKNEDGNVKENDDKEK